MAVTIRRAGHGRAVGVSGTNLLGRTALRKRGQRLAGTRSSSVVPSLRKKGGKGMRDELRQLADRPRSFIPQGSPKGGGGRSAIQSATPGKTGGKGSTEYLARGQKLLREVAVLQCLDERNLKARGRKRFFRKERAYLTEKGCSSMEEVE